jgi:hypothetical protein
MAGEKVVKDGEIVDADDDIQDDVIDDVDDDIDDDIVDDDTQDDDDEDDAKKKEPWMADEDGQPPSTVPVGTHIRMKQKLKGRLHDQSDELTKLREENARLKAGQQTPAQPSKPPRRPKENDFETLAEFDEALSEYDQKMVDYRLQTANRKNEIQRLQMATKAKLEEAVDGHYTRAAKLIQDNGIDTEVYQQADRTVREAMETLMPGRGEFTTDQIISVLGEGSEKVMYFLGRNKNALNELKSLLVEDPTGLRATMYLGQQRERLLNNKQRMSKAPAPGKKVKGDAAPTSAKAKSLLKKRKAAQAVGNLQAAYDIKKQAKQQGIDVSTW